MPLRMTPVLLAAVLSACAMQTDLAPLAPNPDTLAPWTRDLRAAQPDDAFAAVYRRGDMLLVFVAAKHANEPTSRTFQLINQAFDAYDFAGVIAEGFPYSLGPDPARIRQRMLDQDPAADFVRNGESVLVFHRAAAAAAPVWGGEPEDADIRAALLADGFALEDLVGFYALRNIPQWVRERRIEGAGDPGLAALLDASLPRERARLGAPDDVLPDVDAFLAWYERINGRALSAAFTVEEVGPLADGAHGTNQIASAISRARATFLLARIAERLEADRAVLVVYGRSHLMLQRPALDAMLDPACAIGEALEPPPC